MTNTATSEDSQDIVKERLLRTVKKEVKQIMEEAVTKKFIHEESSPIMTLCGAVEACVQHGLKKRALGLFKNSTTSSALLSKISKQCEPAAAVVKVIASIEQSNDNARRNLDTGKNGSKRLHNTKHLWIRIALLEKLLAKIIDYLVNNADKYYEKEALLADPCDGPILASLLVGPCALDYTKMKTADHYWTDPPADELVQRHRIHSGTHHIRPDSPKRPGLQVALGKRNASSSSEESQRSVVLSAREYVESLHQNNKTQLLYGKNNVIVQPKEDVEPLAGYLSLHQGSDGLSIKWTPNQLMNGCCHDDDEAIDRSLYWDYAVTIYLDEIVYLHCHQQPDSGGTIVLVGQDGVQRPPIHFPRGGHLLAFLSCLENGLLPHGQLDPPLWSQRGKGKVFPKMRRKGSQLKMSGTGSVTSNSSSGTSQGSSVTSHGGSVTSQGGGLALRECSIKSQDSTSVFEESAVKEEEAEATDYVFRIVSAFKPHTLPAEMIDPKAKSNGSLSNFPWPIREAHAQLRHTLSRSPATPPPAAFTPPAVPQMDTMQIYAKTQQQFNNSCISKNGHRTAVKQLCDTMKNQILSRAFYGWLSYCRHLKTVRTHLSGLVNTTLIPVDYPYDASCGLTADRWRDMCKDGMVTEEQEIYRLVYFGGCAGEIRCQVWPYLLGHYTFGSTGKERDELDSEIRENYERTMSEWLAVEAIVKQRDKEIMAANIAKLSMESHDGHIPLMRKDSSLSNDVFESIESDDFSHPETVPEETSSQLVTPTGDEEKHPLTSAIVERLQRTEDKGDAGSTSPDEGIGSVGTSMGHSLSDTSKPSTTSCETRTSGSLSDETGARGDVRTSGSLSDEVPAESDKNIIVTQATVDGASSCRGSRGSYHSSRSGGSHKSEADEDSHKLLSTSSTGDGGDVSPASNASNGGVYSPELLDSVALNLHRIDKDVQRCDRNYSYFTPSNLDKLRNVMCTYVWENLEIGYVQGMCDLLAPLLVILDDEAKAYSCFCQLMKRMTSNFPHGGAMDKHFANMRSLIQILDPEIFEHMHQNGDYTHFYFCYRWFLLDFKRELVYEDVFGVWETIWVARHISSPHFVLFIALALVEYYREIIIDNNMDFTDIIKFFNEMAERHSAKQVLRIARDLVYKLQDLIENK